MAGCGDKKIYQWDADTGDLVQVSLITATLVWQVLACSRTETKFLQWPCRLLLPAGAPLTILPYDA